MYRKALMKTAAFLKQHWRSFVYYGCMLAVLCALGYASDVYRQRGEREEAVIPTAELVVSEEESDQLVLTVPEDMLVLRKYSSEALWNNVLGLWENHEALDCRFADNKVRSLCDGVISKIGCDARKGNYIEIRNEKLIVRYDSVKAGADLEVGKKILTGDVIGESNLSMLCEKYMQGHAHIEFILEGKAVDPDVFF